MKERIASLKKQWEEHARQHYQDEVKSAGERFKLLLQARDLGFLEFTTNNKSETSDDKDVFSVPLSRSSSYDILDRPELNFKNDMEKVKE